MGILDNFKDEVLNNKEFNEELDNIITLNDENGNLVDFEFLDLIEYQGNEYVVLLPVEVDEEDDGQVVILQVVGSTDDEEEYLSVDDENLIQVLFDIFKDKFKDEFNFE